MRAANAYQQLHDTHQQIDGDITLPGRKYEPVRDTLRELDERLPSEQPELARLIDIAEARRASLDRDLVEMRAASRAPEQGAAPQQAAINEEIEIERALALQDQAPQDQPSPDQPSPEARAQADHVAPERWTDRGGMVEQQASAMEWLKHSIDERSKHATPEQSPAQDLSRNDREVLDAARAHEAQAQTNQQDLGQSHARDYPAP